MKSYQMFINGEFVPNQSRKMMTVINPSTEEVISEVPAGTCEDVNAAVEAAEQAQKSWAKLPAIARAGYLREIAQGIRENAEALAKVISAEQGKILPLARVEANFTADYMDYMAEHAVMKVKSLRVTVQMKISFFLKRQLVWLPEYYRGISPFSSLRVNWHLH